MNHPAMRPNTCSHKTTNDMDKHKQQMGMALGEVLLVGRRMFPGLGKCISKESFWKENRIMQPRGTKHY